MGRRASNRVGQTSRIVLRLSRASSRTATCRQLLVAGIGHQPCLWHAAAILLRIASPCNATTGHCQHCWHSSVSALVQFQVARRGTSSGGAPVPGRTLLHSNLSARVYTHAVGLSVDSAWLCHLMTRQNLLQQRPCCLDSAVLGNVHSCSMLTAHSSRRTRSRPTAAEAWLPRALQ